MTIRETRDLIIETLIIAVLLSLVIVATDLFSNESIEFKLKETILVLLPMLLLVGPGVYAFHKQQKRHDEINRAVEEQIKRKAEADERIRIYEEEYQREGKVLKKRVLDDLEAIVRGEKRRLDPEALDATKALQMRQGEHPETLAAWTPLMADLSAEIVDAKAMQMRIDDILYPESLEDVEALKKRVVDDLGRVASGDGSRLDPEALEAAKALNEMRARDARRKHEERESEAFERRRQKQSDERFSAAMDEMAKSSARNILRMHGLPETMLDGLPLDEVLARIRALRQVHQREESGE